MIDPESSRPDLSIVTSTDEEFAAALLKRAEEQLAALGGLMDEARARGMQLTWAGFAPDAFSGKTKAANPHVFKVLAR